jgi:hypothetical protein
MRRRKLLVVVAAGAGWTQVRLTVRNSDRGHDRLGHVCEATTASDGMP